MADDHIDWKLEFEDLPSSDFIVIRPCPICGGRMSSKMKGNVYIPRGCVRCNNHGCNEVLEITRDVLDRRDGIEQVSYVEHRSFEEEIIPGKRVTISSSDIAAAIFEPEDY